LSVAPSESVEESDSAAVVDLALAVVGLALAAGASAGAASVSHGGLGVVRMVSGVAHGVLASVILLLSPRPLRAS